MRRYVGKRLLLMAPTAFLATVVIFLLMKLLPGDAALALLYRVEEAGGTRQQEAESLAAVRERFGLDKPIWVQYGSWLKTVGQGEFGQSLWQGRPVRDILLEALPRTMELAALVLLLTVLWAIPFGVLAAVWRDSARDHLLRVISVLGLSIPTIWVGIVFLFTFSRYVGWIPPIEWTGLVQAPLANLTILIFPALIVSMHMGASVMRMTRSQMLDVLREDYIRTAWAKGLAQNVILLRHALRNAILPVLTHFGSLFSVMITGLVVVETVFRIPGMGRAMVDAIGTRDYPVIQGLILINVALILVINLLVDLLYSVIDPRIRYS